MTNRRYITEHELVERLHSTDGMASLVIAGAGTQAIGWILGVAGASRTVLDIQVPYSNSAVIDYMGSEPEQYVSVDTARQLARSAYERAVHLRESDVPVVGISCTATIATDRPKRGDHRCHIGVYHPTCVEVQSLTFVKGHRDREGEDGVVSKLILNALAERFGAAERTRLDLLDTESVVEESDEYSSALDALPSGHVQHVLITSTGEQQADARITGGVLPGSFNPLHDGHRALAKVASEIIGGPVTFEISMRNVDKPPMEVSEIERRLAQFRDDGDVVVTRTPVFYEKARRFPGCTFVIGFDTAIRLVDPRYYEDSAEKMNSALAEMKELGCSFLVAGRVEEGRFRTLSEVPIPPIYGDMFREIPESAFRNDISSTALRSANVAD